MVLDYDTSDSVKSPVVTTDGSDDWPIPHAYWSTCFVVPGPKLTHGDNPVYDAEMVRCSYSLGCNSCEPTSASIAARNKWALSKALSPVWVVRWSSDCNIEECSGESCEAALTSEISSGARV